jgi:hypothetical protein
MPAAGFLFAAAIWIGSGTSAAEGLIATFLPMACLRSGRTRRVDACLMARCAGRNAYEVFR